MKTTARDALKESLPEGFYIYRENMMWGAYAAARDGHGRFLFEAYDRVRWLTPAEKLAELRAQWMPVALEDVDYMCNRMEAELSALK